jgi:hypothetical protein
MRPRRLKVEFYDSDGVRHTVSIDGPVTREKAGKIMDLVELISGTPQTSSSALGLSSKKYDKLASIIMTQLRTGAFNSASAKNLFETTFKEKIPLSTVSTYLTRLADRGILERQEDKGGLLYLVRPEARKQPLPPDPSPQVS